MGNLVDKARIADLLLCGMEIHEVAELLDIDQGEVDDVWSEYLDNPARFDREIEQLIPTSKLWPKEAALLEEAERE